MDTNHVQVLDARGMNGWWRNAFGNGQERHHGDQASKQPAGNDNRHCPSSVVLLHCTHSTMCMICPPVTKTDLANANGCILIIYYHHHHHSIITIINNNPVMLFCSCTSPAIHPLLHLFLGVRPCATK